MAKTGKRSAASLTVVPGFSDARIGPPDHLDDAERDIWHSIVDSLPADYFRPGDIPLLSAYCSAAVFYENARADIKERGLSVTDDRGREYVNPAHQILTSQASSMAQMAGKLRLCPSARYSERKAGAVETKTGGRPWEAVG